MKKLILVGLLLIFGCTPPSEVDAKPKIQGSKLLGGYWWAYYKEYKSTVIYQFTKKNGKLRAYSVEVREDNGKKHQDYSLALEVTSFPNNRGKAKYHYNYKGKKYKINSNLKLTGKKLQVSYSYYGSQYTEIWTKAK